MYDFDNIKKIESVVADLDIICEFIEWRLSDGGEPTKLLGALLNEVYEHNQKILKNLKN